jgi:hypothetical protein
VVTPAQAKAISAYWRSAVRVLLPLLAWAVDGWTAAIGALLIQEGGLWLARRLGPPKFSADVFLAGYALRGIVAVAMHSYLFATRGSGALLLDDSVYDRVGDWLVRIAWADPVSVFPDHQYFLENFYLYVVAGLYSVFGHVPIVPKLLNAVAGALSVVILAESARLAFNGRVATYAAILGSVLPTLVVWSAAGLKDALVLLGLVTAMAAIQRLMSEPWTLRGVGTPAVVLLASYALLFDLRYAFFLVFALLTVLALAIRLSRRFPRRLVIGTTLAGLVVAGAIITYAQIRAPMSVVARYTHPAELAKILGERRSEEAGRARTQIGVVRSGEPDVAGDTAGSAATASLPGFLSALRVALFSPTPLEVQGGRDMAAATEMLVWYGLYALVAISVIGSARQPGFVGLIAGFGVSIFLILTLTEGNLGNLLRHRMMAAPSLVFLAAAGLYALQERRRKARAT